MPDDFDWLGSPVRGPSHITATFGESGGRWTGDHTGLDFAAVYRTPVVAVQSGIVMKAGWENSAYGNIVKIRHTSAGDSLETWYAHLQDVADLDLPESVSRGERIGSVGSTGNTTGPHVHLEVRVDGTPVDPASYLGVNVHPNPEGVGQQFGLDLPEWPDIDLGRFAFRAGLFVGGAALIAVAGYGISRGGRA